MKHAIMIMAHKNAAQLKRLAAFFVKNCDVFIHIDQKSLITRDEVSDIQSLPQVKRVLQTHSVHWGGTSVLDCEMNLLKVAYEESDADYFHLISGQDYPVRPLSYFLDFFCRNAGKEFFNYIHLPHPRWENNTFRRLQYFYPYDWASEKPNPRRWVKEQVEEQEKRGIKRPIPDIFAHLYGSSQWFSITRFAVKTLLNYTQEYPELYRRLWMTFAPEECYVATVLMNLLEREKIVPDNKRFIRWHYENGNRPANIGKEHFRYLLESDFLFARKFEPPYSDKLRPLIERYLWKDEKIVQMPTGGWKYDGYLRYMVDTDFCTFVMQLCANFNVESALDMGCGAGQYVAEWRKCNLPFAGYDANPFTPKLSKLLLMEGDTPCGIADLAGDIDVPVPFDLVVCKDVLPYIPTKYHEKAISNIAKLSKHSIVICWDSQKHEDSSDRTVLKNIDSEYVENLLVEHDFVMEKRITAQMRRTLKSKCCAVFLRNS